MRAIRFTAEIILIFLISTAIILPILGQAAMDYSQPLKAGWVVEKDKNGQEIKKADYEYPDGLTESVRRVYNLIHLPIQPNYFLVLGLCLLAGIIYLLGYELSTKDTDETFKKTLPRIGIAQVLVISLSVVVFILNSNPKEKLQQTIPDAELVSVLMSNYHGVFFLSWFLPIATLFIFDVVVVLLAAGLEVSFVAITEWLERRARQEPSAIELSGRAIVIRENGMTEYTRLNWKLKWMPWPVMFLNRERLSVTTFRAFLCQLANEARKFVTDKMLDNFKNVVQQSFFRIDRAILGGFAQAWNGQFMEWAAANQTQIKTELNQDSPGSAEELLNQVSADTANRIRQELSAEISVMVKKCLADLHGSVLGDLSGISQNESDLGGITPILPEGAKLHIKRGNITIMVIEQKPQIRTIKFSGRFIDCFGGLGVVEGRKDERFRLAFPYTLFVIRFIDGRVHGIGFFYRNSPLASIYDPVFDSNLPNIGKSGWVCIGHDLSLGKDLDLAGQAEQVIAHFWNSGFNTDLCGGFEYMSKRSSDLETLKKWEKQTSEDPTFILKVDWRRIADLNKVVESFLKDGRPLNVLDEFRRLFKERLSLASAHIGDEVSERIAAMDLSHVSDKVTSEILAGEIRKSGETLVDYILAHADKVLVGEGAKSGERLANCLTEAVSESLSDQMASVVNQDKFASGMDIWDIMQRLIPREEETRNGTADSDTHSQAG